jgi:hypothetical protein
LDFNDLPIQVHISHRIRIHGVVDVRWGILSCAFARCQS